MPTPLYSKAEVKEHDQSDDCWIVYKGDVLDVTAFVEKHPGGSKVLLKYAGKDATAAIDGVKKHVRAFQIIGTFKIGKLRDEE